MTKNKILFLSTNSTWGGSEILWTHAVAVFTNRGFRVSAGAGYPYATVQQFLPSSQYVNLTLPLPAPSIFRRILNKTGLYKQVATDRLEQWLAKEQPDIVIISQGNNTEGRHFMDTCFRHRIPFLTITHLTIKESWPGLNDQTIDQLRKLYRVSLRNYFVSSATQHQHGLLLGEEAPNGMTIYNPFIKKIPENQGFPKVENGIYKVAMIGRLEIYHKGYDLLIEVLRLKKWQERPVHFSIYGRGPHKELLNRMIKNNGISNLSLYDHLEDIGKIWDRHHILLMPSRMEGQSLTLTEAMRFQRAAIVTNVGGASELIKDGENGFIADYPIAEYIDAALERAWQRRNEWQQFGLRAAKTMAEKHPPDALAGFCGQVMEMLAASIQ